MDFAYILLIAFAVFLVVFVRTELGLYLVIFSMLLSPKLGSGSGELAESRRVVIRTEDLVLIVVAFTWLAKTAVNKELGLAWKTRLNRPILWYVTVAVMATLVGYATGTVQGLGGFFYVLKYTEYFVVYYMVANNLSNRSQAWRFVGAAFLTAAIVSVIGAAQIPSGQRVSAPFEGVEGEPNTLGGYLILSMAVLAGIALETQRLRVRLTCLALLVLMVVPFAYTLSRASFLALPFVLTALGVFSTRRRLLVAAVVLLLAVSPLVGLALPKPVVSRILYTFEPEAGSATVRLGKIAFDPSTSARLISMQRAFSAWTRRPRLLATDVDGVLTDGRMVLSERGGELKSFNSRDGVAVTLAKRGGLRTAFVTGEKSAVAQARGDKLGVDAVVLGARRKGDVLEDLCAQFGLPLDAAAYIGDDLLDVPALQRAGLAIAVADAAPEVIAIAHIVTRARGGQGALRECVELILRAQGAWAATVEAYITEHGGRPRPAR